MTTNTFVTEHCTNIIYVWKVSTYSVLYLLSRLCVPASTQYTMIQSCTPRNFIYIYTYIHELEIMCFIKFWACIIKIIPCKGCTVETPVGARLLLLFHNNVKQKENDPRRNYGCNIFPLITLLLLLKGTERWTQLLRCSTPQWGGGGEKYRPNIV